ncbi:serine-rich adhesin for platelets isoform X1 [Armigeres subalbatus]|uniref:serine-rich adhesin for platelets isoform X1 n=2 Tax=Armigeres subalbatus TaxID=124917 RepID=UPI002ED45C2A
MNREDPEDSPVEMTVETISPTASDIGSMSDSPAHRPDKKKKKRGLSFKKIKSNAQKLMPSRKKEDKSEETPSQLEETDSQSSSPPTPMLKELVSTESLPAIKEEHPVLQTTRSIDEILGDRRAKKARKPNRAATFVKKIAGRKSKVAPNPKNASSFEDDHSASTTETPLSIKRRTPEGANLSVSENSLYEGDKPAGSFKIEQLDSEPKVVGTNLSKSTETKITLTGGKTESSTSAGEGSSKASSGIQLPASASAGAESPSSASSSSTSGIDKANLVSVASVGESKTVAPGTAAASVGSNKPISVTRPSKVITTAIEDNVAISSDNKITISSLLSGDYIAEINKLSIDKISTVANSDQAPPTSREKFFKSNPFVATASIDKRGSLSREETDNAVETLEVNDNVLKSLVAPKLSSESTAEKLKNIFMKKDNQKKTSAATPSSEPSSSTETPVLTTVRTQEAAKPYQIGNNIKNPNLSGFKESASEDPKSSTAISDGDGGGDAIVFKVGSQVRPDRTSSASKSAKATLLTPIVDSAIPSGSFNQSRSLDEYGSLEAERRGSTSFDESPLSENSRRRIAYVAQPTLFTPEEEELVSGRPSLLSSIAAGSSLDSEDYLESKMSPHGDLLLDKSDNLSNMSTAPTEKREHLYKILVIGELGTGKTSFIKRYVHQFFSQNYRATIGVDFALKVLNWDQNTIIRLQLWDIAGQERFGNMTRVYYKEAVGAFIVFDVTRSATFDAVIKWKQDLDSKVQLPDGKPIPCILLANKSDQQKQGIVTTPAKLDEYVKEHGFAGWFETSAKENVNIEEAAKSLVNKILTNDKQTNAGEIVDSDRFALAGGSKDLNQKKNCAC